MPSARSSDTAPVHRLWVPAVLLLIAYGSLYPFSFGTPGSLAAAWASLLKSPRGWTSFSDVAGNALLFLPLGLVIAARLPPAQRTPLRLAAIAAFGTCFALLLQVAQLWIPSRSAALSDVLWNTVGLLVGIVLAMSTERLIAGAQGRPMQPGVPHLLLVLWLAAELAPLVPAFDWQGAKDALRSLRSMDALAGSEALATMARTLALGVILAAISSRRRSFALLAAVVAATALLKPLVVGQSLTIDDLVGYAGGCAIWLVVSRQSEGRLDGAAAILLLIAYSIDELRPFSLRTHPANMNWVPFSAVLTSMTPGTLSSTFRSLFTFATIGWLVFRGGGMLGPTMVMIAIWVGGLEAAQMWLEGRTADITESVLAIVAGAIVWGAVRWQTHPLRPRLPMTGEGTHALAAASAATIEHSRPKHLVAFVCLWGATVFAITTLLKLPGVPYNVAELFLGSGHPVFIAIFVLAIFWIGTGSAWLAARVPVSRMPVVSFPAYTFAVAMVSLGLLYASVTDESVMDISGSNNLWWFVTNKDIWGAFAHRLFAILGPDVVAVFERPIRYAALYIPLTAFIATALMLCGRRHARVPSRRQVTLAIVASLPWLWLCKGIAFDWSSTDNLNELIARDGEYGWGGGGYLYVLVAVFAANVALLTRVPARPLGGAAAVTATVLAAWAGWELLNLGLNPRVEKYDQVFSGAQFLLGPDRKHVLSEAELFARWIAVYLPGVVLVSAGARFGWPLLASVRLRGRLRSGDAVPAARAASEGK